MFKMLVSSIVAKRLKKKLQQNTIEKDDIKEVLEEIRIALIDADVNLIVIKALIENVEKKVVGVHIDKDQNPQTFLINVIKEELVSVLGSKTKEINLQSSSSRIMVVGLQGSGKTTSVVKIANYLKNKNNKNPLLVACDIYRPAAIEQLEVLGKQNNIEVYQEGLIAPQIIAENAIKSAKNNGQNLLLFDTAGRLEIDEKLMHELVILKKTIVPDEIILVIDSMTGQNILNVAKKFHETVKLTAIMITKFDSDARGGAALSLAYMLKVPIMFIGTGEKIGSIDVFHPDRMAERILGMGDVLTLAEKAADIVDEKRSKGQMERMLAGKMDLEDLMSQLKQITKIGSLSSIAKMVPGAEKIKESDLESLEIKLRTWEIIMSSMTLKERRNPKLFDKETSRKLRVIKGSGKKPDDFNKMISEWKKSRDKMEQMGKLVRSGRNPFGAFGQ